MELSSIFTHRNGLPCHQDVNSSGCDVTGHDLNCANTDPSSYNQADEDDPDDRLADRLLDEGDVPQAEDADDTDEADRHARGREGQGVEWTNKDSHNRILIDLFSDPVKPLNFIIKKVLYNWLCSFYTRSL